mmetsp:Transcript_33772/g.74822  ORF Transcript_33772/g.74822 Transcript_33772/m.74822 type:complete len:275 (+) Transcript_33772:439-1263(+)
MTGELLPCRLTLCSWMMRLSRASLRAMRSTCGLEQAAAAPAAGCALSNDTEGSAEEVGELGVGVVGVAEPSPSLPVTLSLISFILAISFCMEEVRWGARRTLDMGSASLPPSSAGVDVDAVGAADPTGDAAACRLNGEGSGERGDAAPFMLGAAASSCSSSSPSGCDSMLDSRVSRDPPLLRGLNRVVVALPPAAAACARCSASATSSSSSLSASSMPRLLLSLLPPRFASDTTRLTTFFILSSMTLCRPKSTSLAMVPEASGLSMMFSSLRSR